MTETELIKQLKENPANLEYYDALCEWYEENGEDEKAIKVLKEALETVEMGKVEMDEEMKKSYITSYYLDIASLLGGLSKFSESDKYLDMAKNYDLDDSDLHQYYCYRANNFYHSYVSEEKEFNADGIKQACEWAQKSADLSPDAMGRIYMYELLSKLYVELNDTTRTEEFVDKTVTLATEMAGLEEIDDYLTYMPYSYAAECYFNIEDLPNAIRFLHKCENAGKKHSADEAFLFSTYTSLGQCYSFAGEHKKALDYFEKAYAIESDDTQLNEWIEKLREIVDVGGNSKN